VVVLLLVLLLFLLLLLLHRLKVYERLRSVEDSVSVELLELCRKVMGRGVSEGVAANSAWGGNNGHSRAATVRGSAVGRV
jgi:hypothetical protein